MTGQKASFLEKKCAAKENKGSICSTYQKRKIKNDYRIPTKGLYEPRTSLMEKNGLKQQN